MKQGFIRCRRAAVWLAGSAALLAMMTACGGVPVKRMGDEYLLTLEKGGNIAAKAANSSEERASVLSEVLRDRSMELGGEGIPPKELAFMPYAESTFILPDGKTQILTVLYQTYEGARIIEGIQYGSFDKETGELRTVRAFLKDPKGLPKPPKADMNVWSRMHEIFREYLMQRRGSGVNFVIEEQPVISAGLGVAGYFARYAQRNANGSLSRFAAVIEPDSGRVHVLYDINTD